MFKEIKTAVLDILFPVRCVVCKTETDTRKKNAWLCGNCRSLFNPKLRSTCPTCSGVTLNDAFCILCKPHHELSALSYPFFYKETHVEQLLKAYKYYFIKGLHSYIARFMALYCNKKFEDGAFDRYILTSVPLNVRRLNWRGFDHTRLIAESLFETLNAASPTLRMDFSLLEPVRHLKAQAELPHEKRTQNISGAFRCPVPGRIKGRSVLIVDDVYTTGATMNECARVLKKAGVKSVKGFVFAKG